MDDIYYISDILLENISYNTINPDFEEAMTFDAGPVKCLCENSMHDGFICKGKYLSVKRRNLILFMEELSADEGYWRYSVTFQGFETDQNKSSLWKRCRLRTVGALHNQDGIWKKHKGTWKEHKSMSNKQDIQIITCNKNNNGETHNVLDKKLIFNYNNEIIRLVNEEYILKPDEEYLTWESITFQ